jgi:hypothetical protein
MNHIPTASYPICPLCSEHVELENANTDEKGQAVHEECYVTHTTGQTREPVMATSKYTQRWLTDLPG